VASKTSAGKGKKYKSDPEEVFDTTKMNSNFDVESPKTKSDGDDEDFASQQFSGRLKSMMVFLIVLICVVTPYALNFEYARTENSEENLEDFLKIVDKDILGKTIMGATLEERIGQLEIPPNCAIFYSDDPDFNPNALATRICPDEQDNHISFHIKGVFGTHPNNTRYINGEKSAKVKFVATGSNVWATFFDQHNSTMQTYLVAPGNSIDIATLAGSHASQFYENFDAVKILNTVQSISFKVKGLQPQYAECATFYESNLVDVTTEGFMVCHNFKQKYLQLKGESLESVWIDYISSKTKPINYAVLGKKISVFLDFEKNTGLERINMEEGTTHDLLAECKPAAPGSPPPELRPKLVKLISKDFKEMKEARIAQGKQALAKKKAEKSVSLKREVEDGEDEDEDKEKDENKGDAADVDGKKDGADEAPPAPLTPALSSYAQTEEEKEEEEDEEKEEEAEKKSSKSSKSSSKKSKKSNDDEK